MNRRTIFIFIILILILVFLIFFYKLITKHSPNSSSLPIKKTVLNKEEYIKLRYPQASREEQLLLTIAQQRSATISATPENVALAEKVASDSGILEINNCVPKPLILKVGKGNEFKISNNDPIEHRIVFLFKPLKISPSQQFTVKSNLTSTPGLFSYDCDSFHKVGLIYIPKS